ncbi:MAG: hypothetical protein K2X61_13900 [Caulobacteraceae bacterium]|nr:hypothetical protein [Caulobacteraceae bacterium]
MRPLSTLLALPVLLSACAPVEGANSTDSSEPRACFLAQQATSFRADGQQSVYIRTVGRDVFRLDTSVCPGLETNFQIGLDPGLGFSSRLCQGDTVRLIARGYSSPVEACSARVMGRLTDAEIEALPARNRP